ncbi:SGNH/GDSL hydrolase family protein [Sulfitobacter sp. S190]|uniref:SGNH/GDSL hydrolase family protein n=1 Tax=Sulfitobacter sp. S190 TaxID=2867022 RepID=UPI0021A4FE58|nr:SGNH/GDSL hydrolase family protein [Sulfitobacter sp. S190]UWR22547.1 SGNH/GDSL hydrolase family protein [Sulfitobacter sp. S190]
MTNFFLRLLALCGLLFGVACSGVAPRDGGDILVIGDSVLAWNNPTRQDIGRVVGAQLQRDVVIRAVPGAKLQAERAWAAAAGFDIRQQYPGGRWNWVVINGGANDMGFNDCGCGDCRSVVEGLISADGSNGVVPAFLDEVRRSGARVLWMGYYSSPGTSFEGCADDLDLLEDRIKRNLARDPRGHFLEGEEVLTKGNPAHFDRDDTHPSVAGSALLGTALAEMIRAVENRSQNR